MYGDQSGKLVCGYLGLKSGILLHLVYFIRQSSSLKGRC